MNAKKLVMLLAVVAIAVGVWFMMSGEKECDCCMIPSADDATVMVMDPDCSCDDCGDDAGDAGDDAGDAGDDAGDAGDDAGDAGDDAGDAGDDA